MFHFVWPVRISNSLSICWDHAKLRPWPFSIFPSRKIPLVGETQELKMVTVGLVKVSLVGFNVQKPKNR